MFGKVELQKKLYETVNYINLETAFMLFKYLKRRKWNCAIYESYFHTKPKFHEFNVLVEVDPNGTDSVAYELIKKFNIQNDFSHSIVDENSSMYYSRKFIEYTKGKPYKGQKL